MDMLTNQDMELLKRRQTNPKVDAKPVRITTTDGEILVAFITFVDDHHKDVIYDVVRTNQPERYKEHSGAAFVIPFSSIERVEEHSEEGQGR